nr:magnesium transporter [Smithellaceae bacterium]
MIDSVSASDLDKPVLTHANKDFVAVHTHNTIREALESIRESQPQSTILYFYVLDEKNRLVGSIQTRKLLTYPLDTNITSIMATNLVTIPVTATLMDALEFFVLHKFLAFPIVDEERNIRGVIDINVFTQEMLDFEEREHVHSVFDTLGIQVSELQTKSVWQAFRYRFPWLLATITSGTICAILVGLFQATLAESLILAFFLTLVLGLGESVAMQTMAITVHAIHHRSGQQGWYMKYLQRELLRTLLLSCACGVIVGSIAIIWRNEIPAGLVIGSGIMVSLILACFIGVSIPSLLHKLRLDLRVASGPLTLALADICTIVAYFSL